jgi:DNA-binding GntR family transcriptional regulator
MNQVEIGRREVASERVASVLADRILSGSLAPGTRILQDELAEELGASRIPVREALRILSSRGLVTLRANVGAWVSQMTLHDLTLSYTVRERIEPLLLTESMTRLRDSDVDRMDKIQQRIEQNEGVEAFLRLDREFHWTSYSAHQSPQLAEMVHQLWDTTQHYRRAFVQLAHSEGSWVIDAEHRLLLEALRRRDEETASAVLELHIRRTRLALADHSELFSAQDADPA